MTYNLQAVIKCTHENHQEIRAGKEHGGSEAREQHLRAFQGIREGKSLPQGALWDSILDHLTQVTICLSSRLPRRQLSQGSEAL